MNNSHEFSRAECLPLTCSSCHRTFFASANHSSEPCPLCQKGKLEGQSHETTWFKPEKVFPFKINKSQLTSIFSKFLSGVWIKPPDFKSESLLSRVKPVFWPLWLVDCNVTGNWRMEAGFDYQVESAKETYVNGQWRSIKEIKDRIRWEPRLGEVNTRVENIAVPALAEHQNRMAMTGNYPDEHPEEFNHSIIGDALFEAPDIPTEKAWDAAKPLVEKKIDQICQEASGAQHSEKFILNAAYQNPNWTQFYLPMLATYYKDDNDQPQILIINGQTGKINGPRLASPKRGLKIAGVIAIAAAILLVIALLAFLLSLAIADIKVISGVFLVLGLGTGLIALIPALWPVIWNRGQEGPRIADRR